MKFLRQGESDMKRLAIPPFAFALVATVAVTTAPRLVAQSLEGSKWTIEQEGVDTPVLWWLGSQGRVRTGDLGTILAGYKWKQDGDSIVVSVGDTLRFAGVQMANRLVGVRSGPHRQEGWWSGARADGPAAVAVAPSTPSNPAVISTPPSTETMSRPTDAGVTPTSPASSNPAITPTTNPAPRQLRRISREGETPATTTAEPAATGNGHEIRRLARPGARMGAADASDFPATAPVPADVLVGKWVRTETDGVLEEIEAKADGSFLIVRTAGGKGTGTWANGPEGTRAEVTGAGNSAVMRLWQEDGELRVVILTAAGVRRTLRFRRQG
jgi:hypothetical protein